MEQKKTWEEIQAEKAAKSYMLKQLLIAECYRIAYLLEQDAESKVYGYGEFRASELFSKMKELRRDTITLERIQRNQY